MRFLTTNVAPRALSYNFFDEIDKIFNHQDRASAFSAHRFIEEEGKYLLSLDLPGLNKEDIKIDLAEDVLTIAGERKNYGEFNRRFTLPSSIDTQKVEAKYENGVLELTLPKAESAKPRRIEIA